MSIGPLTEYADDPIGFCKHVLGVRVLRYQREIMLAVRDHKSTAVASCHGAGKTYTAALIAIWFYATRKPAVVFTTAPTSAQVLNMWGYIRTLYANAKRRLPGHLQTVRIKGESHSDADWYAFGRSARDGNAAQGLHSANLLIIYDEASGVRDEIRTSLEGALGDVHSRELAIGNPTGERGFFRDSFEKSSAFWHTINLSALRTPNVRSRKRMVPGLVGFEWVDQIRRRFKESSPFWVCRVLGRFFNFGAEKTIPPEWVKAAQERWQSTAEDGPRILLADVAASINNDSTGLVIRAGRRMWPIDQYQEPDTMVNARRILQTAKEFGCVEIRVDATGPGKGVGDKLNELSEQGHADSIVITRVVWSHSATEKEFYDRLMDEMWFKAREGFDPGTPEEPNVNAIAIPPSDNGGLVDDMCEQLSLRGYTMDRFGKIKVESKQALLKRGCDSPDLGDAAVMGFLQTDTISVDFY